MPNAVMTDEQAMIVIGSYTPVAGDLLAAVAIDEFSLVDWGSQFVARSLQLLSEHHIFRLNLNRNGKEIELGALHLIHLHDGSNLASLLGVYPKSAAADDVDNALRKEATEPQVTLFFHEVARPPPTQ